MTTDRSWMLNPDRHCKGSNLMFPEDTVGVIKARAICFPPGGDPCPVWEQCREYALTNREEHGVWAGMSMRARIRTRRDGKPIRVYSSPDEHGTQAGYSRHRRRNEEPCDDCTAGHARYRADQRKKVNV